MKKKPYNIHEEKSEMQQDAGLQCLLTVAAYYGIPTDAESIRHDYVLENRKMPETMASFTCSTS